MKGYAKIATLIIRQKYCFYGWSLISTEIEESRKILLVLNGTLQLACDNYNADIIGIELWNQIVFRILTVLHEEHNKLIRTILQFIRNIQEYDKMLFTSLGSSTYEDKESVINKGMQLLSKEPHHLSQLNHLIKSITEACKYFEELMYIVEDTLKPLDCSLKELIDISVLNWSK